MRVHLCAAFLSHKHSGVCQDLTTEAGILPTDMGEGEKLRKKEIKILGFTFSMLEVPIFALPSCLLDHSGRSL